MKPPPCADYPSTHVRLAVGKRSVHVQICLPGHTASLIQGENVMAPLRYWCMRLIRRRLPEALVEKMLDLGVLLQPGLDTRAPERSVRQLADACARHGKS